MRDQGARPHRRIDPVGAAEHRSINRGKRVACLSNRVVCDCEFDERRLMREAQGNRAAIKPPGAFSFRPFSLGEQRKGSRRTGAGARINQVPRLSVRKLTPGIQLLFINVYWIPAFAGMTDDE